MMTVEEKPDVTYGDVGGCKEQVGKLREVVEMPLLSPERFVNLGIDPPRGALLYGPPGTGKTLCARAVANRTDATFIRVIGSELVQKYVGEGARMVRELFEMARTKKACIIFFDEIDAIGGARFDDGAGGDNEVQRTMLELITQLDGFDARGNIKVMFATNRPSTLDPALMRPGRIDRKIEFSSRSRGPSQHPPYPRQEHVGRAGHSMGTYLPLVPERHWTPSYAACAQRRACSPSVLGGRSLPRRTSSAPLTRSSRAISSSTQRRRTPSTINGRCGNDGACCVHCIIRPRGRQRPPGAWCSVSAIRGQIKGNTVPSSGQVLVNVTVCGKALYRKSFGVKYSFSGTRYGQQPASVKEHTDHSQHVGP